MDNDNSYNRIAEKKYQIIFFIIFLASFAYLMFFLNTHIDKLLDSDDASELILSKMVAEQNSPLIKEWFYSSELRVLNTQLIYGLFFKLFDSWHTVRIFSIFTMCIILLAACYFMFRQLGLAKYFWAAATILILPFSADYFFFVLKGGYYFPHITISFVAIGLLELQVKLIGKKRLSLLLCLSLLAFVAGLGGPRQIIVVYLPTLFAGGFLVIKECREIYLTEHAARMACLEKLSIQNYSYCQGSILAFVCAMGGYGINSGVLHSIYEFRNYNLSFTGVDFLRLEKVINGFINSVGYSKGEVLSFDLYKNILSFAWVIISWVAILRSIHHAKRDYSIRYRFTIMNLFACSIFLILYSFTDLLYEDRYVIPIVVYSIPIIFFMLNSSVSQKGITTILPLLIVLLVVVRSLLFYQDLGQTDNTQELRKVAEILSKEGYTKGYATFWNANILTELSDGMIEVWDWGEELKDIECVDQVFEWLQYKDHVYKHPDGKVFLVVTEEERDKFLISKRFPIDNLIYQTSESINWDILDESKKVVRYYVYGFDNYMEMFYQIGKYQSKRELLINAGEAADVCECTLYPDRYTVILIGENLSECGLDISYNPYVWYKKEKIIWNRPRSVLVDSQSTGEDYIVCTFEISEIAENFKGIIKNFGKEKAVVEEFQILKDDIYYANFYNSNWLSSGEDYFGVRCINDQGSSYGPFITLVPGTYIVECRGKGIDGLRYDATYKVGDELNRFDIIELDKRNDHLQYMFNVDVTRKDCELRFHNNTGDVVQIRNLHMSRKTK